MKVNIIGAGNVGRTLGVLLTSQQEYEIGFVYNQTQSKAEESIRLIGQGTPTNDISAIDCDGINFITVRDDVIGYVADSLAQYGKHVQNGIFVHCSGAKSRDVLEVLEAKGGTICAAHPVKTFPNAESAIKSFSGTPVGIEGDTSIVTKLSALFESIGGIAFIVNKDEKLLYHAATVIICNYLNALMEVGIECYEQSGLDREMAKKAIASISSETLENIVKFDTVDALTGPIARGDRGTIAGHIKRLSELDNALVLGVYKELGKVALKLSSQKGVATKEELDAVGQLLS